MAWCSNNIAIYDDNSIGDVAREQDNASPLSGMWEGPAVSFQRMDLSVQVVSA
jgi:hypothetical protein